MYEHGHDLFVRPNFFLALFNFIIFPFFFFFNFKMLVGLYVFHVFRSICWPAANMEKMR